MRIWNGLKTTDTVYYNGKEYTVLELFEKDGKNMCKIQSIGDKNKTIEVLVSTCTKKPEKQDYFF